ncbi:hypothetical protein VZT92_010198 [Zoarces viviparus]|uniref:Uncharacterized protein n=1 Tax=Zoarces viviparus TaxID=48416 RepID=A0AAW1FE91_ZOAVI
MPRSGAAVKPDSGSDCTCSTDHRTLIPTVCFFPLSSRSAFSPSDSTQPLNAAPPIRSSTSGFGSPIRCLIGR